MFVVRKEILRLMGFRQHCVLCHAPNASDMRLCKGCLKDLHALPRAGIGAPHPPLTQIFSSYILDFPLHGLLSGWKFSRKTAAAHVMRLLMRRAIPDWQPQADSVVMAVPASTRRVAERGFNQAAVLAQEGAGCLNIPLLPEGSVLRMPAGAQSRLSGYERFDNIAGVFVPHRPEAWRNRRVVLIDDVLTTGATTVELAKILLETGARQVDLWTLASADSRKKSQKL